MINNQNLDPNQLDQIVKNANDLHEVLKKYIEWDNKISIWLNIASKVFPVLKRYTLLILLVFYFMKDVLNGGILQKVVDFALNTASGSLCWNLLIICVTIVGLHFINKKYK